VLAIRCLGQIREPQAADRLHELVVSGQVPAPVRLEAARALARLRNEGLEKDAQRLAADRSPTALGARLAAVSMLGEHRSEAAVRLLQESALDPEPAVAAIAVARLIEIDAKLAVPALEPLLASQDAQLRGLGVEILYRLPSQQHFHLLGDRLNDEDPKVRAEARRHLVELGGNKEHHPSVAAEAIRLLASRDWRGLEQSALLSAQLDHKPAAGRLVELLRFERAEVCLAAAWALRKLEVADTLPLILGYIEAELPRLRSGAGRNGLPNDLLDHQMSQLNQLMGLLGYGMADSVLQQFIPKSMPYTGNEARAAAVWALGKIHAGKTLPALARALEERLNDIGRPPETAQVRLMSAIALARIGAKQALPSLRKHLRAQQLSEEPVDNACGWAVEHLTGEVMLPPWTVRKQQIDWFLIPFNDKTPDPDSDKLVKPPVPPPPGR
jgi:HEAT repeat protein